MKAPFHELSATVNRLFLALILPVACVNVLGCDSGPAECDCEEVIGGDSLAPNVEIFEPRHSATLRENVTIRAEVTDNEAVAEVRIMIDGETVATMNSEPWEHFWEAESWADNQEHTIRVRAEDEAGNVGSANTRVLVLSPVPEMTHRIDRRGLPGGGLEYEVFVWLDRTVKLDSVRIRELDGTDLRAHHSVDFGGVLWEAGTSIRMPGGNDSYELVGSNYEVTAFGRTSFFVEKPFELTKRGSF